MIFALICALVAGVGAYQIVRMSTPAVSVLVAAKTLTPGETLTHENLAVRKMPAAAIPQDRVTDFESVVGQHIQTYVAEGDPIRNVHLAEVRNGGTVAARLRQMNPGMRAFTLPENASANLLVEEGDKVDLIAVTDQAVGGGNAKVSEVIAAGAPVIYVSEPSSDSKVGVPQSRLVVVALTPEQALRAALALKTGEITAVVVPIGG